MSKTIIAIIIVCVWFVQRISLFFPFRISSRALQIDKIFPSLFDHLT